jgi:O-succinylbenzoate synthase
MNIEELTIREISIRLTNPFETSFGTTWDRRILLVEARCDGITGWGEITAGEGPFYNSETTDTAWAIFRKFVAPLVLGKSVPTAGDVLELLEPIRGHEMTKAALENALWDIEAQQKGMTLSKLLGGTRTEIASGVSLGIRQRNSSPSSKKSWPTAISALKSKSSPARISLSSKPPASASRI